MQPASSPVQPSKRRVRSVSDRKKHAGWRHCPRCGIHVSTNGRNYYHHMYKCDRVFFAHLLAQVDYNRPSQRTSRSRQPRTSSSSAFRCPPLQSSSQIPSHSQPTSSSFSRSHSLPHFQTPNHFTSSASASVPTSASAPGPVPTFLQSTSSGTQQLNDLPHLAPLSSPSSNPVSEPAPSLLPATSSFLARDNTARVQLSEMQRVVFLQQLCFLRIYDRTVDVACARVEEDFGTINLICRELFDAVRMAKLSQSSQHISKQSNLHSAPQSPYSPPKSHSLYIQPPATFYDSPPSPRPVPSRSVATAMAISSVINN